MVISIGCDNLAIELKNAVIEEVKKLGHEVLDFGVKTPEDPYDYPDVAYPVAKRSQTAKPTAPSSSAAPVSAWRFLPIR